jgi:hypothetical protein
MLAPLTWVKTLALLGYTHPMIKYGEEDRLRKTRNIMARDDENDNDEGRPWGMIWMPGW